MASSVHKPFRRFAQTARAVCALISIAILAPLAVAADAAAAADSDTWTSRRWSDHDTTKRSYRRWLETLPAGLAKRIAWGNGAGLFGLNPDQAR